MKLFAMALVAGLRAFETLAVSSAARGSKPAIVTVKCDTTGTQQRTTVTAPGTTLQLTCPSEKYTVEPAAGKTPETQEVYADAQCKDTKALTFYCPSARGESSPQNGNPGVALTIPALPPAPKTFYLQCRAPGGTTDKNCVVEVSVGNAVAGGQRQAGERAADGKTGTVESGASQGVGGPAGASGPTGAEGPPGEKNEINQNNANTPNAGNEHGGESSEQDQQVPNGAEVPGGTTGVQTCKSPKSSITIRIPEQGSMAKFACGSGFDLYPSPADKVFSQDCKKQETLKDMTRTQTSAPTSPPAPNSPEKTVAKDETDDGPSVPTPPVTPEKPALTSVIVYTLKVDKKPPKKKLCYLCAKQGVSETKPGPAENYCIIYVESGARTQIDRGLTFALVLPCLLAALYFT